MTLSALKCKDLNTTKVFHNFNIILLIFSLLLVVSLSVCIDRESRLLCNKILKQLSDLKDAMHNEKIVNTWIHVCSIILQFSITSILLQLTNCSHWTLQQSVSASNTHSTATRISYLFLPRLHRHELFVLQITSLSDDVIHQV